MPDTTPCNSPIEDIFYADIQKRITQEAEILRQFECTTRSGTFYLDFLIIVAGRRVGVECGGKDFHERVRYSVRDRAIIDAGHAHRIYRLPGRDICYHLYYALDLIRVRACLKSHDLVANRASMRRIMARYTIVSPVWAWRS